MIGYIAKCATLLLGLWTAEYFGWIPYSQIANLFLVVIVPIVLICLGCVRRKRTQEEEETQNIDAALNAVESQLIRRL